MPINYLTGVKATKQQRRVLSNYITNGGDRHAAYWIVFGADKIDWPIAKQKHAAKKYFQSNTMRSLLKEAEIESRVSLEKQAVEGYHNAISKYSITKERILEELAKIAFAQATDVMSWGPDGVVVKDSNDLGDASAAVGEVIQSGGGDNPVVMKVKLLDKQQALVNLGREFGMFSQKVDVKGQVGVAVGAKFILEGK